MPSLDGEWQVRYYGLTCHSPSREGISALVSYNVIFCTSRI